MSGTIEAFLDLALISGARMQVNDGGGGGWVTLSLTSAVPLSEALTTWQTQANASGGLALSDYAFSVLTSPANLRNYVRFSAGGNFSWRLYPGSRTDLDGLASALGFTSSSGSGASTYTGDELPDCYLLDVPLDYDAPRSVGPVEMRTFRWSRHMASAWHAVRETTIRAYLTLAQFSALQTGPLLQGKTRVYPPGYVSGAYTAANPRGYLDVFPVGDMAIESFADGSEHSYLVTFRAVLA